MSRTVTDEILNKAESAYNSFGDPEAPACDPPSMRAALEAVAPMLIAQELEMITDNIGFDGGSLTLGAVEREKHRYRNSDNAPKDAREIIAAQFGDAPHRYMRADDIIAALHAKGLKILAREPTEAMDKAGAYLGSWYAMPADSRAMTKFEASYFCAGIAFASLAWLVLTVFLYQECT